MVSRATPDRDLQDFIDGVPKGGRVLDLGCGPGNSAAAMAAAGLITEAWDATPEMVRIAQKAPGVDVRLARFEDLNCSDQFDGIWSNFALLHAPRADMPSNLDRITQAFKPNGFLHIGLKTGSGEKRDAIGRFYSYFSEEELREMLVSRGFEVTYTRHGSQAGLDGTESPFIILKARLK